MSHSCCVDWHTLFPTCRLPSSAERTLSSTGVSDAHVCFEQKYLLNEFIECQMTLSFEPLVDQRATSSSETHALETDLLRDIYHQGSAEGCSQNI